MNLERAKTSHEQLNYGAKVGDEWTLTVPSVVTAANTVEENGDQATSPTAAFRSKVNIGELRKKHIGNL